MISTGKVSITLLGEQKKLLCLLQGVTTTMDAKTTRLSVLHLGRNSKNPFVCFIFNTTTLHIAGKHYFIKLRLESKQIGHQCLNGFSFIGLSFTRFS